MKIKHRYLEYGSNLKAIKPVRAILDKYSHRYTYKEDVSTIIPTFKHTIEFFLYENDPDFEKIKQEISKFLEPQVIATEYEKTDMQTAEWFIVNTGEYQYPQPDDGFGYLNATFNLDNYCTLCGIGKVQNAPYRLKTIPKQFNSQFWGLHWAFDAIFVRQETKDILEKEKIAGIQFSNPVIHKTIIQIEGFYQLHIDKVLDKGFDSYNATAITCKYNNEENLNTDKGIKCCGRIKFHHPKVGGYLFDKTIFGKRFDIVKSYEYFGSGASANRLKIVSKKFKDIVEKNKLKGLSFIPVMHNKLER